MHSCSACSSTIDPERFELLYYGKKMKNTVCQVCANAGIAQPEMLRGMVHCDEDGEHEGLSVLTSYQWSLHLSTMGKSNTTELAQAAQEEKALEGLALTE